jgi:hypothetical protein
MANVIFGNHAAHVVPRVERERVREFFLEVLGAELMRVREDADDIRLGDNFYMGILYGDHADESEFQRTGKSVWLELKSDNLEEMIRKILAFGVRTLEIPDRHLYFQAPGGQVFRLVGADEDLSEYEGTGQGPDVAKVKEALKKEAMTS